MTKYINIWEEETAAALDWGSESLTIQYVAPALLRKAWQLLLYSYNY